MHQSRRLVLRLFSVLLLLTVAGCAPEGNGTGGISDYFSSEIRELDSKISEKRRMLQPLPELFPNQQTSRIGYVSRPADANTPPDHPVTRTIRVDLGVRQLIDTVVLVPADFSTGPESGAGYGFPVRWRLEASDDPTFEEELHLLRDYTGEDFPNPRRSPVVIPIDVPEWRMTRYLRLTATKLWTNEGRALLALGEFMVLQGGRNVAAGLPRKAILSGDDSDEDQPTWSRSNLVDGQSVIGPPQGIQDSPTAGWQSLPDKNPDAPSWVMVDLGKELPLHEIRLLPAFSAEYPARRGYGFPVSCLVETAPESDPSFAQPVKVDDYNGFNPRENPVSFRVPGTPARYVRVTARTRSERLDDYVFALSEIQIFSGGENVALGASVSAQNSPETSTWAMRFLTDGYTSQRNILPWLDYTTGLEKRREIEREIRGMSFNRGALAERVMHTALKWSAWGLGIAVLAILYSISRGRRARRRDLSQLRRRLAQDIHDEIGSGLGTISLLSQMGSGHSSHPEETREEFAEIHRLTRTVTESLRDIVWFIRPDTKTVGALAQRLKETTASMLAGMEHEFRAEGPALERELPLEHKRQVLLFFKEALHNVVRHSGATRAEVSISGDPRVFRLTVHDNGCGFDQSAPASGAGMTGMKQRAVTLGGRLQIETACGAGTTLALEVPWRAPRMSAARPSGT